MNILAGLYRPDAGEILVGGQPVAFGSPARRHRRRSGHGPPALHPGALADRHRERPAGPRPAALPAATCSATTKRSRGLAATFGMRVDPRTKVWQLSVGEQQRVEILKMLYRGARVLIMDEPTAVLAPQEVDELFKTLRTMTASGRSIVFISHKLAEVLAIADRVTVMRRGKVTAAGLPAAGATKSDLARLMVGREVLEVARAHPVPARARWSSPCGEVHARERQAAAGPARCLARRAVGRDPGHRRRGRQRPERAGPGHHRPAAVQRADRDRRRASHRPLGTRGHPERRRARARGPDRRRQRSQPVGRRQPDDEELPRGAHRARLGHRRDGRSAIRGEPQGRVPHRRADRSTRRRACSRAATSSASSWRARSSPSRS